MSCDLRARRRPLAHAGSWLAAVRWAAVVLAASALVVMHAALGAGPGRSDAVSTQERAVHAVAAPAAAESSGHRADPATPGDHDCADCTAPHGAASLGHLCLAVVGGLLLAGAGASWTRRHRLPALDRDVHRRGRRATVRATKLAGVPPWTHLSLAQLSLWRV